MAADAANFKEYVPLLLFTCPPPFRGWVASAASRKGAAVWAALRPGFRWFRGCGGGFAFGHTFCVKVNGPPARGLWPPDGGGLCSLRSGGDSPAGLRVVVAADAADFKECNPLHYFTSPPSFRGAQVIEEPSPPALDNFHPSCYYLLKIRSIELHTVELRFLSIRNISRSALFSVGRLFLQGSRPFVFHGGLYENI